MTARRDALSSPLSSWVQAERSDARPPGGEQLQAGGFRLGDLIDLPELQAMAEAHSKASGMPIGIIDAFDGSVLVGVGWQAICMDFHRKHPETLEQCHQSDASITSRILDGKPFAYKCRNGLWDIGVPIRVRNIHVATLFLGQFFFEEEKRDLLFFEQQAEQYGFDKRAYMAALGSVPSFSKEVVDNILLYNVAFAKFIGRLATNTLLLTLPPHSRSSRGEGL